MIKDIDFGEIIIDGIPQKTNDATRVMSFNLRYCDDEEGSVKNRSVISKAIIEQYSPDSVGVQEATGEWMDILSSGLENYAYVGERRDEDANSEYSAVFYLKSKFNLLDSGTIWLSDTPEEKYTKYEESVCTRIATWAVLENKETGVVSVVALVYPNQEECEKLGLAEKKDIEAYLHDKVQEINKRLASYKHITKVELRDEPFEKTTSRKIKRHVIKKD